MSEKKGSFVVKKITEINSVDEKTVLPESDLTIQTNDRIVQFEYKKPKEDQLLYTIKSGCYSFSENTSGVYLQKMEMRKYSLLKSVTNTSMILSEANKFFSRLHIYDDIKRDKKRALLLCSVPGVGKTASINEVCNIFLNEDPEGTCVAIWDTSSIKSQSINSFFLKNSKFDSSVKRLIFVMEDVEGGSEDEFSYRGRSSESSLLNLLDGVGSPFKGVPTFIIATTNNPEKSVAALIDRPGRFDKVIELSTPNKDESRELLKFIANRELTEEELLAADLAAEKQFSIAHLQEIVVRSLIDDVSLLESAQQLAKHKERFGNAFQEVKKMGIF